MDMQQAFIMEAIKEVSIKLQLKVSLMTIQLINQVVQNKGQNLVLQTKEGKVPTQLNIKKVEANTLHKWLNH